MRLLAFERAAWWRGAGDQPGVGHLQQPPKPRLRAHYRMKRPPQRDRTAVIFFLKRCILLIDPGRLLFLRARPEPARDQEGRNSGSKKNAAQDEPINDAGRTKHYSGRPH